MSPASPERGIDRVAGAVARAVGALSRRTGAGAGSSLPGLVVERLAPGYVARRGARFARGIVLVSGTNGKTTTTGMIDWILSRAGVETATNQTGANLFRGVATALADASPTAQAGVFEVDEGALPRLVPLLKPRVVVLTNVFRDQLDRFGEPESVARLITDAVRPLGPGCVVANADDPLVWHAVEALDPIGFGVELVNGPSVSSIGGEPEICPRCGNGLVYQGRTIAHLGRAHCPRCRWTSGAPLFLARPHGSSRLGFMPLEICGRRLVLPLGGVHNAYNAVAAVAAAAQMGVPPSRAIPALEEFHPRFGRTEELDLDGRPLWLVLMKNPAGAAALVQQVCEEPRIGAVVVCVSDRWADGRDISWIWDAEFEKLTQRGIPFVAAGRRAADVAVRLRYADASIRAVHADPLSAIGAAHEVSAPGQPVVVLATYTSMLDVRRALLGSRAASLADVPA